MASKRIGRLITWQRTRTMNTKSKSPYWDYVNTHSEGDEDEMHEDSRANPDVLGTNDTYGQPRLSVGDLSKKLSGQQRKVFALYIEQGLSVEDIAELLDISRPAVYVYLRRIGEKLKTYL